MRYVEHSLIPGETILYRTGLHWIELLGPGLFGGFFVLMGIFMAIGGVTMQKDGALLGVLGIVLATFGTLIVVFAVVTRNAIEMAVTSERVIIKVGLIRKKTLELFLSKVESISVEQGLFGRVLGYGNIVVRGTGGTNEPFKNVRLPLEFRRQVQQHSEAVTTA